MTEGEGNRRWRLGLAEASLALVACAAVMGWAASFVGLHDFGTRNMQGYSDLTAWFVPATFDGAAFGTTLITYRASINGRGAFRARILMWSFTAVSAWINWVHQPIGRAQFVAAGLPIAAVAVFDVVMLEMRGDYETRHGRRAFRLRPGLLVLRWLVDRTGTSDAFRAQIRSISVTALAGLGSDLGEDRFAEPVVHGNRRIAVKPDPDPVKPDPVRPDVGAPDTAAADPAPPEPAMPDPRTPDPATVDTLTAGVDTPEPDVDTPDLAQASDDPVDQATEQAEPVTLTTVTLTTQPDLAESVTQPDQLDLAEPVTPAAQPDESDQTDQPAASTSRVGDRSDSYLYSDSYVPSWRTDSFDEKLDSPTRPAMEPVEPTTSTTASATASAVTAANGVVDRYDPAKYDPVRYDPNRYDTSKYEGARYDPAKYNPVRYDPNKYDTGKADTDKADADGAADPATRGSAETMEIPSMSANALRDAARDQVRGALTSGAEPPTHQELAERYGRSRRWAREQLRVVRDELEQESKRRLVSVNGNGRR